MSQWQLAAEAAGPTTQAGQGDYWYNGGVYQTQNSPAVASMLSAGADPSTLPGYSAPVTTNGLSLTNIQRQRLGRITPGTSAIPGVQTPGTATAQGYQNLATGSPTMPAPLGGASPLTDAVKQGFGMGLAPFNPSWYDQLGKSLYNQANQNLQENILPGIDQAGMQAGQYGGGSRADLAKGVAIRGMNQNVMNAMAPQYATGYENWLNRGVQTGGLAMNGLLGLGSNDVARYDAQTKAASAAAQANGTPFYTSPWGAAIGGAGGIAELINILGKNWGNTSPTGP